MLKLDKSRILIYKEFKASDSINYKFNNNFILSIFLLIILLTIILSLSFASAASFSRANVAREPGMQNVVGDVSPFGGTGSQFLFDRKLCEAGQDFVLQISPTGCIPSVVRSDLLEDQNVAVFCPVVATQLNPLVSVNSINSISFSGETPPEVSGIGYYPARAAVRGFGSQLSQPVFNNVGYAVIVLRQQRNESAMPDFVSGNLTARIIYNVKNAFGVGQHVFYLPEMNEDEWNENYRRYVFWNGKGYLRAESVTDNSASISIYSDRETYGTARTAEKRKISIANLDLDQRRISPNIYMPGFDFCRGSLQLELKGLENPGTTSRLNINGDYLEFKEGEKFIDNKCYIRDIDKQGVVERTTIRCSEDEGTSEFSLTVSPRIKLAISQEGVTEIKDYSVGDKLYETSTAEGTATAWLAYITSKGGSGTEESLTAAIVIQQGTYSDKNKLAADEINTFANYFNRAPDGNLETLPSITENIIKFAADAVETLFRGTVSGEFFRDVSFGETENVFGKSVKFIGYADAVDADLSSASYPEGFKSYYDNAIKDYDAILDSFANEKYEKADPRTLGEQALFGKTDLAIKTNQLRTAKELCNEFKEKYPDSQAPDSCDVVSRLSSTEINFRDVFVGGNVYRISSEGIREPSESEFSATISVNIPGHGVKTATLSRRNDIFVVNSETNEYVRLVDIPDRESIKLNIVNLEAAGTAESIVKFLETQTQTLKKGFPESFKSKYTFTLQEVKLKKIAKVSVKPQINDVRTNATFGFKIGIEKRGIKLSPEKTKEIIESLKKTIDRWRGLNNNLGNVVRGFNYACIGVGTTLTIKNFFNNIAGSGIARQKVMRTPEVGWFDKCEAAVNRGQYGSVDACLLENSDEIEDAVKEYANQMSIQSDEFKALQKDITTSSFIGEDVVDTKKLRERYVNNNYKNEVQQNLQNAGITSVRIGNEDVSVSDIISVIGPTSVFLTQARDLQLNARLLSSDDSTLKDVASKQVKSVLGEIYVNSKQEAAKQTVKDRLPTGLKNLGVGVYAGQNAVTAIYDGGRTTAQVGQIPNDVPAQAIIYNNVEYIVELELVSAENYQIVEIYDISGNKIDSKSQIYTEIKSRFIFKYYDRNSYKNQYISPKVRYYESGKYKGLPALVPFDENEGWYAATKPVVPIGGAIEPFADSGRVTNFYLCNVGTNKKEEFNSGIGDDICQGFVYGASQPPVFAGLDAGEATTLKNRAERALQQAAQQYSAGVKRVNIEGWRVDVGEPATGTPDIQCQDFMSPGDCNLLFNVCDPVVCPSSRCDLGGTYPVDNVIQSGIAGSLALCLPNFPEIKVPICLSGVHAGIDSYLSVLDSYKQCLQTSLDTGQTVGVCDEIHSVYMCEFLWRQGLPVVNYAIPKVIGKIFSQDVRGGGEYLNVQDAWQKAGDSVSFFTDYYAKNSFRAFKARSTDTIGSEVCKNWVSLTSPQGGKIFDALTNPASPPQFYGRFDEIPFTTATVTPISQYKVFYHIYAGKDVPAYYQVYLRTTEDSSSFYQNIPLRRIVDSNYIAAGQYVSQTRDFTAPSGYKEMCIVVNGQEECGFKQVTTDFGVNYLTELYVADQASRTDITSEAACVSGTSNIYALLNPNLQAGAEEAIDPAIYNRGITRVCATDNPGTGTDSFAGTNQSRWQVVGYCGETRIKCWLDTESVKNVVRSTDIENQVLDDVSQNYLDTIKKELGVVENFDELIENITAEKDSAKKINLINANLNKVFFNHEKGFLTLLRGNIFKDLALEIYSKIKTAQEKGASDMESSASQYGSPVFEFEYGGGVGGLIPKSSIYYRYWEKKWHWSLSDDRNKSKWNGTETSPKLSDGINILTTELKSKSYLDGLRVLMNAKDNNQGSGFLSDTELSTNNYGKNIRYSVNVKGRFTFEKTTGLERYFEFDSSSGKWKWSGGTREFFIVPEIPEKHSKRIEIEVTNAIKALEGKNFIEGAAIIFYIGYEAELEIISGTPTTDAQTAAILDAIRGLGIDYQVDIDNVKRLLGQGVEMEEAIKQSKISETEGTQISLTCSTTDECKIALGNEIIRIAKEVQREGAYEGGISVQNAEIKQQTGVNNFECLVLTVANHESIGLNHCGRVEGGVVVDSAREGNPLYCNGNIDEVLKSGKEGEESYGIMQINLNKNPNANVADFEANARYGAKLLMDSYYLKDPTFSRKYECNGKIYSGWMRVLREYNGWPTTFNIDCTKGNPNYVEDVLSDSNKNAVKNLFPECRD